MTRKKPPAEGSKKPRNVAARNLADPRYRHKVEKNPGAYTRKPRNRPGRAELHQPPDEGDDA